MTSPFTQIDLLQAAAALVAGLGLGFIFFASLRHNVRLFAEGKAFSAGLLQAGRILMGAAVLGLCVRFGALPLLSCTLGMLLARQLVIKRVGKAP